MKPVLAVLAITAILSGPALGQSTTPRPEPSPAPSSSDRSSPSPQTTPPPNAPGANQQVPAQSRGKNEQPTNDQKQQQPGQRR
jgi:hypothetical protein